jgi:hypothetical protein
MIKGTVRFYDEKQPPLYVVIGTGEDVKAPRHLSLLEQQGWIIDDNVTMTYKAWLAGKRQGDIPADSKFEDWSDTVAEIDLRPSVKQIEQAVALGTMDRESADKLIAVIEAEQGEASGPLA